MSAQEHATTPASHRGRWSLIAHCVGALALAAVLLGVLSSKVKPPRGRVVVHVTESDVDLTVGGKTYRVRDLDDSPIYAELPAGHHTLRLARGSRLLYREAFDLDRGAEIVLSAWDSYARTAAPPGGLAHGRSRGGPDRVAHQ